jgi:hypothetical protein
MTQRLLLFLSKGEVWVGALGLAAFLVLFWALRGAPLGQATRDEDEGEDSPGAAYRDRVVLAMVGGLLLVLGGAYLALSGRLAWSFPAFALGFGIVLTLIAVNRRYRHASPSLRRTIELSNMALTASLIAGILIMANVLAFRSGVREIDFTREGTFTLSSLTMNQLKALKRPVTFTAFFGDSRLSRQQLERVQQMLDLYKAANPGRITLRYIDPFRELERYEALVKKYPDIGITQGGGVLIEYGDGPDAQHVVLRNSDLFEIPPQDRLQQDHLAFRSNFRGEDALTNALVRLREGKKTKMALIVGHGEPPTGELNPRKAGLGLFKTRLSALGYEVVEVNLLREAVPAEAELVAVVGPKAPFNDDEVAKLKAAIEGGKSLLAVVGGSESQGEKTGLEGFFHSYNLEIGSSVIVDPLLSFRGRPEMIYAPVMGQVRHPIVDTLANRAVLMPRASPITIIMSPPPRGGGSFNHGILPTAILRTSDQSWGETDLTSGKRLERGDKDQAGPLTVGVAVTDRPRPNSGQEPRPRLVLFSSRYLADNLFLEIEPTNLDLLVNAIGWLRGQAEMGGIAPKTHIALTLSADPVLRARLILVPTVMAVLLIISLGLTTYLMRRE